MYREEIKKPLVMLTALPCVWRPEIVHHLLSGPCVEPCDATICCDRCCIDIWRDHHILMWTTLMKSGVISLGSPLCHLLSTESVSQKWHVSWFCMFLCGPKYLEICATMSPAPAEQFCVCVLHPFSTCVPRAANWSCHLHVSEKLSYQHNSE